MKQQKKYLSTYKKKVHVDGKEWSYRITSRTLEICNPERTKKFKFFTNQDSNVDWDEVYSDYYCCDWCCPAFSIRAIKPSQVSKFIQAKILGTIKAWTKQLGTIESPVRL